MEKYKTNIAIYHKIFTKYKISKKGLRKTESSFPFEYIQTNFSKTGLKPVFSSFEKKIKKQFHLFGISFESSIFSGKDIQTEIFSDNKILVLVEKVNKFGGTLLQITFYYKDLNAYLKIFKKIKRFKKLVGLKEGTFFELTQKEKLDELLEKDSPNGKLIKNIRFKNIFSFLGNSSQRDITKKIAKKLGQSARSATKDQILGEFDKKKRRIVEKILNNTNIFTKSYRLRCKKCNWVSYDLIFENLEDVRAVINKGKFSCMKKGCFSDEAEEVEIFAVKADTIRCLGGTWLEKYVDDILKQKVRYTWPGKMNTDDELDNVFIFAEKTFLVECKDTSFGMSDLYSLMIKAKAISADEILVITTQNVSSNVINKIKELNEAEDYQISLIIGNQKIIKKTLEDTLSRRQNEFFEQTLIEGKKSRRYLSLPMITR